MRKKTTNNTLDAILQNELNDPEFAKAWAETELEDQINDLKRLLEAYRNGDISERSRQPITLKT